MVNNAKQNKKKGLSARVYLNLCRASSFAGSARRPAQRRISDVSRRCKVGRPLLSPTTPDLPNFCQKFLRNDMLHDGKAVEKNYVKFPLFIRIHVCVTGQAVRKFVYGEEIAQAHFAFGRAM